MEGNNKIRQSLVNGLKRVLDRLAYVQRTEPFRDSVVASSIVGEYLSLKREMVAHNSWRGYHVQWFDQAVEGDPKFYRSGF